MEVQHIEPRNSVVVSDIARMTPHTLVSSRTKGFVSLAGKQDASHLRILANPLEGIDQFLDGLGPESIANLRPVDRDLGDPVVQIFVADIFVFKNRLPIF